MKVAVTGATGRLGREVTETLASAGGPEVLAISRREFSPDGSNVVARIADYGSVPKMTEALRDTDVLVLITSDGDSATVIRHHRNIVEAAVAASVPRVVSLSSLDADWASPFCYANVNAQLEEDLVHSGIETSIAAASVFSEFFADWVPPALASGELRLPAQAAPVSFVSRLDVASVLSELALNFAPGRHVVTGPEALEMTEVAARVSRRTSKPLRYVDISPERYVTELAQSGMDPWWIYAFAGMFASIRQGRWSTVTTTVQEVTGREPSTLITCIPNAQE